MANVGENELSRKEPKYKVPEFFTTIPVKMNPLYNCKEMKDWIKWVKELSGMEGKKYDNKIAGTVYYEAHFHPFCDDMERWEMLCKLMMYFFLIDDHFDSNYMDKKYQPEKYKIIRTQVNEIFDKLLNKPFVDTTKWKPYSFTCFSIFENVFRHFNKVQKDRFVFLWKEYFDSLVEEREVINKKYQFKNLEELFAIRRISAGVWPTVQLIEYADDLYVPEKDWQNSKFKELIELNARLVIMVNDVYSYAKEMTETSGNERKIFNTVSVMARLDQITYYEAMLKIIDIIVENEKKYWELEKEVLNLDCLSESTKLLAQRTKYFISSCWTSGKTLDRYINVI